MDAVLAEIIRILTGGLTSFGQGIGTGLSSIVQSMFIDTSGQTYALTIFGGIVCVFGGLALAVALTRKVFGMLTTFGARK